MNNKQRGYIIHNLKKQRNTLLMKDVVDTKLVTKLTKIIDELALLNFKNKMYNMNRSRNKSMYWESFVA